MTTGVDFTKQIAETASLMGDLSQLKKREDRINYLLGHPVLVHFVASQKRFKSLILKLKPEIQEILFTLMAMGQGAAVFSEWEKDEDPAGPLKELALSLKPLQKNYKAIGGLVGYQLVFLKLLQRRNLPPSQRLITKPQGLNIEEVTEEVKKYTRAGIENLSRFGEVYPVGGAADRMDLHDEATGEPLPQAKLVFDGKTLLEGLLEDLSARELLFQKITGKQTMTPVALMTSSEKRNHEHIFTILEENNWFGRPKELFFLFQQPLVPVMSEEGLFATKGPLELSMKPGGHGIIWELMKAQGVFDWFQKYGRAHLLVRQINNPMAGVDRNLLVFGGKGYSDNKAFGFLSCSRLVGAPEGMNVVQHSRNEDGFYSSITNIEYTDFSERGLKDEPEIEGSLYSGYPANTNILFGHIPEIKKALKRLPLPGLLINLKGQVSCYEKGGERAHMKGGRVECTMQNIADVMENFSPQKPLEDKDLKTFILFNKREKTLSVTKQKLKKEGPLEGTPQGAWRDRQNNYRDLFSCHLNFTLPDLNKDGFPSTYIHLHPSLGPLFEIIQQKIQNGSLKPSAELHLEISELFIKDLQLDGSLVIQSAALTGSVFLKNVTIKNLGVDKKKKDNFWSGNIPRKEKVEIILHGVSEFVAEGVEIEGSHRFEVPDGHRLTLSSDKGKIKSSLVKIKSPSWNWKYQFTGDHSVLLTFNGRDAKLLP